MVYVPYTIYQLSGIANVTALQEAQFSTMVLKNLEKNQVVPRWVWLLEQSNEVKLLNQ